MLYLKKGNKKGTLVFLHGNSSSAKVYNGILESGELPYTKIAIDLNGHGKNLNEQYGVEDFLISAQKELVHKVLSEIEEDVMLVGNSLGGHIAIEVADENPKVKGLLIMGTPPVKQPLNLDEAFVQSETLGVFFAENTSEELLHTSVAKVVHDTETVNLIIKDFQTANPVVRRAIAQDVTENNFKNQFKIFTELQIPKCIIAGDADPSVSKPYLEHVVDSCKGQCEMIKLQDCGHYPTLDQPKLFISNLNVLAAKVFAHEYPY
jgi:pimeloyl-ACP methyl ester carboxylesterase